MLSNGISTIDVRDPRAPRATDFIACPPNTRAHHIQVHDGLLLAVNGAGGVGGADCGEKKDYFGHPADADPGRARRRDFTAGIRVFSLDEPGAPARDRLPAESTGWGCIASGGPAAAMPMPRRISRGSPIISYRRSTCRTRRARWSGAGGCPGCAAGGETPAGRPASAGRCITRSWPATWPMPPGATAAFTVLDVADPAAEADHHGTGRRRSAAARTRRCRCPTAGLLVVADEATSANCAKGIAHLGVRCARPGEPGEHRDAADAGGGGLLRQGRQVRPAQSAREPARLVSESTLIFATYQNAGVRVFDIADAFEPQGGRAIPCRRRRSKWSISAPTACR